MKFSKLTGNLKIQNRGGKRGKEEREEGERETGEAKEKRLGKREREKQGRQKRRDSSLLPPLFLSLPLREEGERETGEAKEKISLFSSSFPLPLSPSSINLSPNPTQRGRL